ncbi:putative cytochrome b5 [Salinomyces thailandicus]|uniref:Putative cytochrome b5 n=1 Tax=Salinomyces thailandicus TaxID=706561 RepID=A0A4U0TY04_9PEZI|nr:putative cytochrome b5 [Salinomyces thailandica]
MADKQFTYSDVSEHTGKKDLYLVIHDKVYNSSSFIDEHPHQRQTGWEELYGGEEVLLDVGGQDATEAFEDVGHSDEAREILEGLLIGTLKRQEGDPPAHGAPSSSSATSTAPKSGSEATGLGIGVYALILVGGALAFGAYQYLQAGQQQKA